MGRDGTSLPYLYQTRKTPLGEYRRIVYARPAPIRPFHPAPIRRGAPQGRADDDRTLHGLAFRARPRKDLAGPLPVRHPQLLQLPAHKRPDRSIARRIRRHAEIREAPARHPHHRRDRPHHRHRGHAYDQGYTRQRHARSALFVRATRLGAHLAAALRPLFRGGLHPCHRQGRQAAAGADQHRRTRQDTALSRRAPQRSFGRRGRIPQQPGRATYARDGLHDPEAGRPTRRHRQTHQPAYVPALVCHAPARRGRQHPAGTGDFFF